MVILALLIGPQGRADVGDARRGLDKLRAQRRRRDLVRWRRSCGLSAPRAFGTPMHCGVDESGPAQQQQPCSKSAISQAK
eukprot:12085035-Alexandrium_andersonii.AAC.1